MTSHLITGINDFKNHFLSSRKRMVMSGQVMALSSPIPCQDWTVEPTFRNYDLLLCPLF